MDRRLDFGRTVIQGALQLVSGVFTQPRKEWQSSIVQMSPSSQSTAE